MGTWGDMYNVAASSEGRHLSAHVPIVACIDSLDKLVQFLFIAMHITEVDHIDSDVVLFQLLAKGDKRFR